MNSITIILAAGNNTRFTHNIPSKVLYQINNTPLIINCIKTSQQLNSDKLFIVVNKDNHKAIKNTIESYHITAKYIIQKDINGISSAVSLFQHFTNDFILILGDTYTAASNLHEVLEIHKKYQPVITTTAIQDDNEDAVKRACTIELGKNNKIKKIIEKPDFSTGLRGCGIYVCNPKIFKLIEKYKHLNFTNIMNYCDSRCVVLNGICNNINTIEDANHSQGNTTHSSSGTILP